MSRVLLPAQIRADRKLFFLLQQQSGTAIWRCRFAVEGLMYSASYKYYANLANHEERGRSIGNDPGILQNIGIFSRDRNIVQGHGQRAFRKTAQGHGGFGISAIDAGEENL